MKALAIWYFDTGWLLMLPVYCFWALVCSAKTDAPEKMPRALLLSIVPPVFIGAIMLLIKYG